MDMRKTNILVCKEENCNSETSLIWRDGTRYVDSGLYRTDFGYIEYHTCVAVDFYPDNLALSIFVGHRCDLKLPFFCEADCGIHEGSRIILVTLMA